MRPEDIRELLERVASGELAPGEAFDRLRSLPFTDIGVARVDSHRELRSGIPEVVYGAGKSAEEVVAIAKEIVGAGQRLLVTRLDADKAEALRAAIKDVRYNPRARTAVVKQPGTAMEPVAGPVAVLSAGTADGPVAEEAIETLDFLGVPTVVLRDVGVSGIHRLLASRETLESARVAIVVAGMEGALPSVVGGLTSIPVIAVPTSVGYGASFGGLAALLAMMNSCAAGVTVVNIDNGFGAAVAAAMIVRSVRRP
ncbi:MAG: nickel pincer cofactor biosynthesis protein LarB [Deltaproteobacteria bacterium]|nr:MAG: nickel pincer cofactor biosynthesis protein LarB [Deltaproteobacteria bacterium]